jgi:putative SOS response-associated peptidase YedK
MCRRYALTSPPELVRARFGYSERPDFPPRAEIKPTEPIAVVMSRPFTRGAEREFRLVRWGFLPGFVKDVASFPLIVNARAESVLEKPSFAAAFKRRRCLAPADGFYAGRTFVQPGDTPFGLAALYETYLDASGAEIDTSCILTIEAEGRAPAILAPEDYSAWLDHETTTPAAALALIRIR